MAKGVAAFRRRMRRIPKLVREEVTKQLEKEASKVVAFMESLNPLRGTIEIGWTWGEAPEGALSLGRVEDGGREGIFITIYATAATSEYPSGFPAIARWFEFGTAARYQKTKANKYSGEIKASPYFFPPWRAERRRVKSNINRAVKRAFKKA